MEDTILLNWDGDFQWWFLSHLENWENIEEKAKRYFRDNYANRGIGDVLFNVFAQNSVTPSKVFLDRMTKAHIKTENGIPVDYSDCSPLTLLAKCWEEYGVDLTRLWMGCCKESGIRPWLSFRMNDNHNRDDETHFLRSHFFYEVLEKGWNLGKAYRSGHRNWNYAVVEVRRKMLSYIEEQLQAYDVYGIELDFLREARCVPYFDGDYCQVMTEFMGAVRAITRLCGEKWGQPIKILVRLPRDITLCKKLGFDVRTWAQKGYVDAVSPCGHWLCTDTGMPIGEWTAALAPYGVEVYAGLEMNIPTDILPIDTEIAKAHTVQYAAQGSARTYIYNFYHPYLALREHTGFWGRTPTVEEIREVWNTCGDLEKCKKGIRRHILTQESLGFSEIKRRWAPLPAAIGEGISFEVQTGGIGENAEVTIYLGVKNAWGNALCVSINGSFCAFEGVSGDAHIRKYPDISPEEVVAFRAEKAAYAPIAQTVTISGAPEGEIFYLELKVKEKE